VEVLDQNVLGDGLEVDVPHVEIESS